MSNINNFQYGMQQPSLPDVAMQQMLDVGNDIRNLSQAVAANNRYMVDVVQMEIEKSERASRKRRKKEVSAWVAVVNENFGMVKIFDDGTKAVVNFSLNLIPDFEIFQFQMKGLDEEKKYVGIHFRTEDFWLIGEKSKISGKKLYEDLVKKGVIFNGEIPRGKIQDLLYAFFAPEIEKANVAQIPALAGWFNREFISAETFWLRENEGLLELPVRKKHFSNYEEIPLCPEKYFEKIRNVADWKNRIWMMIYPIGGMLSSILWENGIRLEKYLNFVILEGMPMKVFRQYLQVFNRDRGGQEISQENILQAKDEVLILDVYSAYGESKYKREQKIQNFQSVANGIINCDFITGDGFTISCPVAIFSDRIARKKFAINIFVDADFFESERAGDWVMQKEDVTGIVFSCFVKYCEKNFDEISKFLEMGEEANPETAWLCFVFKIFQRFWESYGVDMMEMADLPESIDFRELLQENLMFEDDLIADFVKIVRTEIRDWSVKPKNEGTGNGDEIVFNDDFIWIPVWVLNHMFSRYGISEQRYLFLEKLKEENLLITDGQGLSRKVQVSGKRYESYQFRRGVFYVTGMVDIVELGKEDANAER